MRSLFLCFAALFALVPQALAQTGAGATWEGSATTVYATSDLNLRSEPRAYAPALLVIPAGAEMLQRACEAGWCAVTYQGTDGYVAQRYTSATRTAQPRTGSATRSGATPPAATGSSGTTTGSGARSTTGSRRTVAVQCSGTTKKGARCRRMTRSANGRCYQHGG